ncbi:MAG: hypothetical protein FWD60_03315 [Candidatus Azobacteroides sp.]|nr:hypothetical protein [Candidatus Azobacteroides sp.]
MNEDKFRSLFENIPLENPSDNFTEKLMQRIEKEAVKTQNNSDKNMRFWLILTLSGMLVFTCIMLYIMGLFPSLLEINNYFGEIMLPFKDVFKQLSFNPSPIMFASVIVLLLLGDTILRSKFLYK